MTTKSSSILVTPVVALRTIPDTDRDAVRRFLFEAIRGMGSVNDKRWRKLWARIWRAEPGEGFMLYPVLERSLVFHNRWFAIEGRIFAAQDAFTHRDRFRDYIKVGAGFGEYQMGKDRFGADRMVFVPHSTSFESTSDDEMHEFVENATAFLHTDRPQRKFWPHLKPAVRAEMVETLFRNPDGESQWAAR